MREKYRALFRGGGGSIANLDIHHRKVGSLDVKYVAVEHKDKSENYPVEQIQQLIKESKNPTKILMEYFTPELEKTIFNHPVWGWYARSNAKDEGITDFSSAMEEVAKAEDVNILVMDPANSSMHDFHEILVPVLSMPTGLAFVTRGLFGKVSRRKALGYFSGGTAMFIGGAQSVFARILDENGRVVSARDSRREMVARGIRQYAETHEEETLVLLYPRTHRDAILYYSDHPDEPNPVKKLAYDLMPGITREIREYQFGNLDQSWNKVGSTPIR